MFLTVGQLGISNGELPRLLGRGGVTGSIQSGRDLCLPVCIATESHPPCNQPTSFRLCTGGSGKWRNMAGPAFWYTERVCPRSDCGQGGGPQTERKTGRREREAVGSRGVEMEPGRGKHSKESKNHNDVYDGETNLQNDETRCSKWRTNGPLFRQRPCEHQSNLMKRETNVVRKQKCIYKREMSPNEWGRRAEPQRKGSVMNRDHESDWG